VLEPKYERMLLEAEATRQINREGRMTELERWVATEGRMTGHAGGSTERGA